MLVRWFGTALVVVALALPALGRSTCVADEAALPRAASPAPADAGGRALPVGPEGDTRGPASMPMFTY